MIAMRVADENDLGVLIVESQLHDAVANERHILFEIRVDQDVPLRCVDQVNSEICRPDVIQVPCNFERRERTVPIGIALCHQDHCECEHAPNTWDHLSPAFLYWIGLRPWLEVYTRVYRVAKPVLFAAAAMRRS